VDAERMLSTGQVARHLGITVRTVYRWEDTGRLHPVRLPSGQRRFCSREVEGILRARTGAADRCAVYARVSSEKQAEAGNLDRQRERLLAAATARGYEVAAVVTERASGLNEKRRGLRRLFRLAAERSMWCWWNSRTAWPGSGSPTS
jgi:putative resolvase